MQKHMIAMGDSLTEGIGEEVNNVELKSWVIHFSKQQPTMQVTNIAKRGLISREIRESQLDKAISLKPDLVSLFAGGNDILKGKWNHEHFHEDMEYMIHQLANGTNASIITCTLPDFTLRLPIPIEKKEAIQAQTLQANDRIQSLSQQYGLCLIDFWNHPLSKDPDIWSSDGIHPNSVGYQKIGQIVYESYKQWSLSHS
ncbi:SGNH/GDSL hydrolase family protein [Paenibacillus nasutitermitis]|uniref:Lipase/acylhydrolase n=1 Tax=Paenibacillus nasutitermitis TaxID=1652958 RepID=A0A916YTU5_9BACL|nr:SGNH/GDSL hydrolase family protein [Paenibacillus nasutitermitis]GGD60100.1 lipase/acylhydrolase [Paenibacillus nasutitermitis]